MMIYYQKNTFYLRIISKNIENIKNCHRIIDYHFIEDILCVPIFVFIKSNFTIMGVNK